MKIVEEIVKRTYADNGYWLPPDEVIPLIRCRECLYRDYDNCPFNEFSEIYKPEDDFFCANGVKRDD